jgi:hypothetical protein
MLKIVIIIKTFSKKSKIQIVHTNFEVQEKLVGEYNNRSKGIVDKTSFYIPKNLAVNLMALLSILR